MMLYPSYFGFETIDELRGLIEANPGETIGEFSVRIAEFVENDEFLGDRQKAACVMLCFLSDIVGDDAIEGKMQALVNRFFRLLRSE